jgi:hypothetical protein
MRSWTCSSRCFSSAGAPRLPPHQAPSPCTTPCMRYELSRPVQKPPSKLLCHSSSTMLLAAARRAAVNPRRSSCGLRPPLPVATPRRVLLPSLSASSACTRLSSAVDGSVVYQLPPMTPPHPRRSVLFLSPVWPERSSSAAGVRTSDLIRSFLDRGDAVAYASPSAPNAHTILLQDSGVVTFQVRTAHCAGGKHGGGACLLLLAWPAGQCVFVNDYNTDHGQKKGVFTDRFSKK